MEIKTGKITVTTKIKSQSLLKRKNNLSVKQKRRHQNISLHMEIEKLTNLIFHISRKINDGKEKAIAL